MLTRDSREKESKKYGLKKARKAPQYSKRSAVSVRERGLGDLGSGWTIRHRRCAVSRTRRSPQSWRSPWAGRS
ncbi:MAG: 30S ribosomal protein S9 [Microthrixaceae bacterium]